MRSAMLKFITISLLSIGFANANPVYDNFGVVVNGDANLGQGVHVHGGAYIGGDLTVSGWNSSFGSNLERGDTSLVVNGNSIGGKRLDLMGKSHYIGGSNSNHLQNIGNELQESGLPGQFFDFYSRNSLLLSGMEDTSVNVDDRDSNNIRVNLVPEQLNVINFNEYNASFLSNQNSNLLFNNFTENTYVVINYDLSSDLIFKSKNQNLQESLFDNIIWNFYGGGDLVIDSSVSTFKGSILATDSFVDWRANDIDGQLVAGELSWGNTSQSHLYSPWENMDNFNIIENDEIVSSVNYGGHLPIFLLIFVFIILKRNNCVVT